MSLVRASALRLLAVVVLGAAPLGATGCSDDCGCQQAYRDCVDKAPPGAAKADCAKDRDECERGCDQGPPSPPEAR